jgi:diguanylate cyclase (GGDEF)-like protein
VKTELDRGTPKRHEDHWHINRYQLLVLLPWSAALVTGVVLTWSWPRITLVAVVLLGSIIAADQLEARAQMTSLSISPTWLMASLAMALLNPTIAVFAGLSLFLARSYIRIINRWWNALMLASLLFTGSWVYHWLNAATGGTRACSAGMGPLCSQYLGGAFTIFIVGLFVNFLLTWIGNFIPDTHRRGPVRWSIFWHSLAPFAASGVLMVIVLGLWSRLGLVIFLGVAVVGSSFTWVLRRMMVAEDLATELQDMTRRLAGEQLYRALANHLPGIIVIYLDADLKVRAVEGQGAWPALRQSLEDQLLLESEALRNLQIDQPTHQTIQDTTEAALNGHDSNYDIVLARRTWEVSTTPIRDGVEGVITGVLGVLRDVTDKRQFETTMFRRAHYDALTDLPNRASFAQALEQATEQANLGTPSAVMMLDLDRFKQVNDTYGHDAGDELLTIIAQRLLQAVRDGDIVSRLAGDEFTIILPGTGSRDEVERVAERIIATIHQPVQLREHLWLPATSIGCAFLNGPDADGYGAMRAADQAMYISKAATGNRFTIAECNRAPKPPAPDAGLLAENLTEL